MTLTELLQAQHRRLTEIRLARGREQWALHVSRHGSQKQAPGRRNMMPRQRSEEIAARARFLALAIPCMACGSSIHLEVSHIVPLSEGGNNAPANLQWLCHPCHVEHDDKHLFTRLSPH